MTAVNEGFVSDITISQEELSVKSDSEGVKNYGSLETEIEEDVWRDRFSRWVILLILVVITWTLLYLVVHTEVLPSGGLFLILTLLAAAELMGRLFTYVGLPALLGMLLTGIAFRTTGIFHLHGVYPDLVIISRNLALSIILVKAGLGLDPLALHRLKTTVLRLAVLPCLGESIAAAMAARFLFSVPLLWSFLIGNLALSIILVKAGLGLDPLALHRLKTTVLRLAVLPCLGESIAAAMAARFLFSVPLLWSFLIGFILSPISPAVVVPILLGLKEKGYGEEKGIATLVIAASSIDDILSISVFGVLLAYIFSPQDNIYLSVLSGPLALVIGLIVGCLFGLLSGKLTKWKDGPGTVFRCLLIGVGGFVGVLGSPRIGLAGAGPLAAITAAFVANIIWTSHGIVTPTENSVARTFSKIWLLVQPALFGFIGAEIDLTNLESSIILQSLLILLCGLVIRVVTTYLSLVGMDLNPREMLFVNLAWLPKATVQAALGSQPLDLLSSDAPHTQLHYANLVLTTAVLAILLTAPIGSIAISLSGPKLLSKYPILQ